MNDVTRLLELAQAGNEEARAALRSSPDVSVCRMATISGQTRSLPELHDAPPKGEPGRTGAARAHPRPASARTVRFSRPAFNALREEIFEFDGDEVGGPLLGSVLSDGSVRVEQVVGSSDWAERSAGHVRIERGRALAIERASGLKWIGDWHSHRERLPKPSQPDFTGWQATVRSQLGVYVGVIGTVWLEDEDWVRFEPRFCAWVATADRCDPAQLTVSSWR